MPEKIKAIQPKIIVEGTIERPYYGILYYDTSDKIWHFGYGSYNLENVVKWRQEYIEVVAETADIEVVRHGEWLQDPEDCYGGDYICSICGNYAEESYRGSNSVLTNYCSKCGAKMDGGKAE